MQLFTLNIPSGRPSCVHNGWSFSSDGTMLIELHDGRVVDFPRILIREPAENPPCQMFNGIVRADGQYGSIFPDKNKQKNNGSALLVIVAEGNIVLPPHLYTDHRVEIYPVANTDSTFFATVIRFLKAEELSIMTEGDRKVPCREVWFNYNRGTQFPEIQEVKPHIHTKPAFAPKKSWWRMALDITFGKKTPGHSGGVTRG